MLLLYEYNGLPKQAASVGSSGVLSCREDPTALALLMIANGEEQLDDLHCGSAFKLHGLKLAISRGHDCPQDNNEQY